MKRVIILAGNVDDERSHELMFRSGAVRVSITEPHRRIAYNIMRSLGYNLTSPIRMAMMGAGRGRMYSTNEVILIGILILAIVTSSLNIYAHVIAIITLVIIYQRCAATALIERALDGIREADKQGALTLAALHQIIDEPAKLFVVHDCHTVHDLLFTQMLYRIDKGGYSCVIAYIAGTKTYDGCVIDAAYDFGIPVVSINDHNDIEMIISE